MKSSAKILVINSGSSSHKCALFSGNGRIPLWKAHLQWKEGFHSAHLQASTSTNSLEKSLTIQSAEEGLKILLNSLWEDPLNALSSQKEISVIGHRVVLGGEKFRGTVRITPDVKREIKALCDLAPLHNPANLKGIITAETLFPNAIQFAVFDTAFHVTLPEAAAIYPGPYKWKEQGIRRYGFHGISHQYCARHAANYLSQDLTSLKMIVCHLGAGASLCAIQEGKSIDTTMGFTPLEGLMMASRCGSIDPGIIFHLLKNHQTTSEKLDEVLNKESGLLGLSGISEDYRDVFASYQNDARAKLAIDVFIHRLRSCLGMMIASLKGLDVLVFTAGIGENSPFVREMACLAFPFLGLAIDPQKNHSQSKNDREISTAESKIKVLVIPTQEEWEIAHECFSRL